MLSATCSGVHLNKSCISRQTESTTSEWKAGTLSYPISMWLWVPPPSPSLWVDLGVALSCWQVPVLLPQGEGKPVWFRFLVLSTNVGWGREALLSVLVCWLQAQSVFDFFVPVSSWEDC